MNNKQSRGPWLQVGPEGDAFYPLTPRAKDITLSAVVGALSKMCRFGGHCGEFYSVAQHCVVVSHLVPPKHARTALLHDAAEAYTGDICQPFKQAIREREEQSGRVGCWSSVIKRIERTVAKTLNCPWPLPPEVKHADLVALATEQRDLMPPAKVAWSPLPAPWGMRIVPLNPLDAYELWFARYLEVTDEAWRVA